MFQSLRSLLRIRREPDFAPAIPAGQRVYAIGDVHGRLDLLRDLIERIETDDREQGVAQTTVILLGDLIDRGPDSAGVLTTAREWGRRRKVRYLSGNHEEMFLKSFTDIEALRQLLRYGGKETLLSYPLDAETYRRATLEELQQIMPLVVPRVDLDFLAAMETMIRIGDYVFAHAGIRPGVPLDQQVPEDLRWIRAEFTSDNSPRDFAVVHGHTITDEPELSPTRIGIDTGAFASGRLTAIGLEGTRRWLLATGAAQS